MARLVIKSGILQAEPIVLKPGTTVIGRAPGNDVELKHPSVSGTHCEITVNEETLFVRDLGSTNGTFVDGQLIREAEIASGQFLKIGAVELIFEPDGTPEPAAPAVAKPVGLRVAKSEAPNLNEAPPVLASSASNKSGAPLVPVAPRVHRTFFQSLTSAFGYPLKRDGLILLIAGTLFFGFLDFLTSTSLRLPLFLVFPFIIALIAYGYLAAYLQKVIVSSAAGEEELPDYPEFSNWWEDIVQPIFLMATAFVVSFGPAVAAVILVDDLSLKLMFAIALGIFGCFYLPMALIAVSMYGTIMALNPILIVPSIVRTLGPYLVACAMLALLGAVKAGLGLMVKVVPVPVLPTLIAGFISLYFLTLEMRVLGLLYYHKKDELGWVF